MRYEMISADCHIDLVWLPPDLFTDNASAALKERMPYVTESEKGPRWVSQSGADFGLMNGMGSAGREYVPGQIHRSDRMASTGLYEDGHKGIRRLTDPNLRLVDQDRDGVQGEVLYGVLGASMRLNDAAASTEVLRIYNEWLDEFCRVHPERYAGIACIPNHSMDAAVTEVRRVAKRGVAKGIEVQATHDMTPLYDPSWNALWEIANETRLPVHVHQIGSKPPETTHMAPLQKRQADAVYTTQSPLTMSNVLLEIVFGGVFEAYPEMILVLGEAGIGWIPYVLEHMDLEWEEQYQDLTLSMRPSEYWHRNCRATYQTDAVGLKNLEHLGEDNVMWGSDFPHPDGVWPDSKEFIARELSGVPDAVRHKIICANAAKLYGFPL